MPDTPAWKQWPSAWWNDTLGGKLLAYELPEQAHLRSSFGYWRLVEERMIRLEAEAAGKPVPFTWDVARQVEANHKNDATYKEINEAWQARCRAAAPAPEGFTYDELTRLVDLFDGANDPVTAGIAAKAWAMLDRMDERKMG